MTNCSNSVNSPQKKQDKKQRKSQWCFRALWVVITIVPSCSAFLPYCFRTPMVMMSFQIFIFLILREHDINTAMLCKKTSALHLTIFTLFLDLMVGTNGCPHVGDTWMLKLCNMSHGTCCCCPPSALSPQPSAAGGACFYCWCLVFDVSHPLWLSIQCID